MDKIKINTIKQTVLIFAIGLFLFNTHVNTVKAQINPETHSTYIPKSEVTKTNKSLQENVVGIGVYFQIIKDTIEVIRPAKGSPSELAGIISGDKIVEIDDSIATGQMCTIAWVFSKLRGKEDTKVTVKIKRDNQPELLTFTMMRKEIPHIIESYTVSGKNTDYLKSDCLSQKVVRDFLNGISTNQSEKEFIRVYPNPVNDYINISAKNHLIRQVQILEIPGNIIKTVSSIEQPQVRINFSNLSAGLYILRILLNDNTIVTKKITKQ